MHRFRVGALECAVLFDGDLLDLPPEMIYPASRRAEWPRIERDEEGLWRVPINCLLVRSAGRTVLLDTGNGTIPGARWRGGGGLVSELAAVGVEPPDVELVVLSHLHRDHVGGATTLQGGRLVPTFPRARHLAQRADWEHFTAPGQEMGWSFVRDSLTPLLENRQLELVEGEAAITAGVRLLPAPGHTPGHSVALLDSQGHAALYVADLVHHRLQFTDPDLVRDEEAPSGLPPVSRRRIIQFALSRTALIVAAHEPHPGLGRLVSREGRVEFVSAAR